MPFHAGYPMATENRQFRKNTSRDQISRGMVNRESTFPMTIRINKSLPRIKRNLSTFFLFIEGSSKGIQDN
jgi:hypothetical protein